MEPHTFKKRGRRFFVSTSIISLAFGYPDRLFNGRVAKARDLPNKRFLFFLHLNEKDLPDLELVARSFYHQMPEPWINLDISFITTIASHSEK